MGKVGNFSGVATSFVTLVLRLVQPSAATNLLSSKSNLSRTLFEISSGDGRRVHPEIRPGFEWRDTGSVSLVFFTLSFGKWLGIPSKLTSLTLKLCGVCHPRQDHFASLLYSRVPSFVFIPSLLINLISFFYEVVTGRELSKTTINLLFSLVVTRENKLNSPYCRVARKITRFMSFYLLILILILWLLLTSILVCIESFFTWINFVHPTYFNN